MAVPGERSGIGAVSGTAADSYAPDSRVCIMKYGISRFVSCSNDAACAILTAKGGHPYGSDQGRNIPESAAEGEEADAGAAGREAECVRQDGVPLGDRSFPNLKIPH